MAGIFGSNGELTLLWRGLSLFCALLALALSLSAVKNKSVTVDEYQQLPAGLLMLRAGDPEFVETRLPPLSYVVPALPLVFSEARLDPTQHAPGTNSWLIGLEFERANRESYESYFFTGRCVAALFLALTLALTWGYARSLYGERGAFLATASASACPTLLAHGSLITPDIFLAAGILGGFWALDFFLRRPGLKSALLLGLALGVASAAKYTGLLLFGLFPCLTALYAFLRQRENLSGRLAAAEKLPALSFLLPALLTFALALALVFASYGFHAGFPLLSEGSFSSPLFQWLQGALPGWLPFPLPTGYVRAIDSQLAETGYLAYLCGHFNRVGFYSYYLVAFLVKTPAALLLLFAFACFLPRRPRAREALPALGFLFFLFFFSLARHKNVGVRYLLFLYPLMAVWIGRLAESAWLRLSRRMADSLAALALASAFAGTFWIWPDYLAYFNLPSGGPAHGHAYLLDSNLDWGQDLVALRKFMAVRGIDSIDLAYAGRVNPETYGIRYNDLRGAPAQRWVAISANLLWGRLYFVNGKAWYPKDQDFYASYRGWRPAALLGHSIYVYDREALASVPNP